MTGGSDPNSFEHVAERRLIMKSGEGAPTEVILRIGKPYWRTVGLDAACPVEIIGMVGRTRDIPNIDPIEALKSAIAFAESFVNDPDLQNKLYWPDGEIYDLGKT